MARSGLRFVPALTLLATVGSTLSLASAQSADDPAQLIEQMSSAVKTLNYEGTFLHMQGGNIESMHILHSSDSEGELERMVSLNGEAREVIRTHSRVTCIWPRNNRVILSKSKPRSALPQIDTSLATNSLYELRFGEPDRVAGLDTQVVEVAPRDELRYGYRFWIDKSTSMLLRFMLVDTRDKVLEEVMFTAISYPERIDPARFEVDVNESQATWMEPALGIEGSSEAVSADAPPKAVETAERVEFKGLPAGYAVVSETYSGMPIDEGPVSHFMLSDGLASVSVYVEHVPQSRQDKSTVGLSNMGVISAYGLSLPDALVTVVGEVPVATVERIAQAVTLP